jgi:PAS domain S-box-containing protein
MRRIRKQPPTPLSLRSKALVLTGAIAAILLVLLYVLARLILFNSFADLEKKEVVRDTHRVVNVLHNDQADLSQTASDWANWDDTYAFVADENSAYIESNLIDDTFTTLQINLMLFFDESGQVVYGEAFRPGSDEPILLDSSSVLNAIYGDGALSHYRDYAGPDDSVDGLVITPDGPMMITVQPIRRSDRTGTPRGALVMGRYLDPARIAHIAQVADVQMELRYVDDPALPQDFKTAVTHLEAGTDIWTRALNGDSLAGYRLLDDISSSPALVLRIGLPRDISHEGQQTVWFFLLAAAILALSLIAVSAGLVERVVLVRLLRLSQAVRQISRASDPNGRVPVSGGDELAELGQYLNEMLAAIQKSRDALWSSEARYRTLFENANDAILLMRHDVFIDCNPRALVMFGCVQDQIVDQTPYADHFSPPLQPDGHSSREKLLEKVNQALTGFPQHFEWQHTRYDGTPFDADVTLTRLELSGEVLLQMMIQDVTERHRAEEALRESEEEFSRLFDRVPVNLYRTTPDGQLIMANPALLALLGYSDLGALQSDSTVRFYVDPADRDRWRAQLERDGMINGFRTRLWRSDGTPIWVEDTARAVRSRDGHTLYYEGALKDITEQVQAEAERERLLNQMRVRAVELSTVAEISHQITTILDIDTLLWEVSRLIKEKFDLYHVHIYLLHGDTLKLAAGEGEVGRQLVARGTTIPLDFEHSLVARAARTREVVRVNDVSVEPDFMGDDLLPNTRSEMAIPIIIGDELLGVLNVEDDEIGRFSPEDVNIKTTLAAPVAIAIHNARLFTDSARRLAIIENSNDLIALARLETYDPLYINAAGLRLLGYDDQPETFYAMPIRDHYLPEDLDHLRQDVIPTVRAQGFWRGENWVRRRDGTVLPVEQMLFAIPGKDGHPRDLATIMIDITARKQAERALQRANRAYHILSDCSQTMVRAVREDRLLDEICAIIVNTGSYRFAWVAYADGTDSQVIQPMAYAGFEAGYLTVTQPHRAAMPLSPSRKAIQTGEAHIVRDIASDPDYEPWREAALKRGYHAMVALPLQVTDEVFGSLNVYAAEADAFDNEEIALLIELASDLAYGITVLRTRIERQQAVEQLQQVNTHLEKRNAQLLALHEVTRSLAATLDVHQIYQVMYDEVAQRLLGAQHFTVALYDAVNERIIRDFSIIDGEPIDVTQLPHMPLGSGPNSETIRTRQPRIVALPASGSGVTTPGQFIHLGDEREPHSALYVPLISGNTLIGVMNVQHYAPDAFQDADINILSIIANQAATAIQNARLFAAERDQRMLAEALSATTVAINTLELDDVLACILENIDRVLPHDAASIFMIEGDTARVVCWRGYEKFGMARWQPDLRLRIAETRTLQHMFTTRQPLIIPDTRAYEGWLNLLDEDWIRSYASVPIQLEGEVIGFINLVSATPDFFKTFQADRLQAFSVQAATAIHHARLFAAERHQRTLAEALHDTIAALSQTLDPDAVLDRILDNIRRVLPHDTASIMLVKNGEARIVRHAGFVERGLADKVEDLVFPVQQMPRFAAMVETGRPTIIDDTQLDENWTSVSGLEWLHAYIGAPIKHGDQLIGVLNLDSATPNFFTEQNAVYLQVFADQAAIAIHNAQLFAATQQHAVDLQAQTERLALVNRVSAMLSQTLDEQMIYAIAAHELQTALATQYAGLVLFQPDGESGRLVMDTHPTRHTDRDQTIPLKANPSIEHVRRTRRPLVSSDVLHDPLFAPVRDLLRARGTASLVIVPLVVGDEVIGTLGLDSTTPREFSEAECDLLATIANQVSIAIAKAQLYAAERDQRIFAEALSATAAAVSSTLDFGGVLDRILENVGRAIPHDASNIMLLEGNIAWVVGSRGYGTYGVEDWLSQVRYAVADMPDWQNMLQSGHPYAISDTAQDPVWRPQPETRWIRSTIKAPIIIEGEIIGILHLDSETPGAFSQHDADRLKAFADQAAIAIHNARLFTAERDQRLFAEALSETAMALTGSLTLDEVTEHILSHIGRVIPHDGANLLLVNLETRRGKIIGCRGYEDHGGNEAKKRDDIPLNFIDEIAPGRAIIVDDVTADPRWEDIPDDRWIRGFIGIPIHLDGQIIGMLNLDSATPGRFTEAHAARLQAFADQAALAIRSAQLFERVQQHAAELEQRVEARTKELEQQRAQLQAILDSMGEGVIYDEDLQVKHTNRALTELTGYTPSEFASHPYLEPLCRATYTPAEFDALIRQLYDMVDQKGIWRGETLLQRADDSRFDAALTATSVRNAQGEIIGAVTVIRDISQEKALQEQRVRFIANASHELRTPLANIKTRLYLLQRQPERAEQHIRILNQVSDGMAELVENLLDVSRFERGKIPLHRRETDLQELVNRVVRIQQADAERKGITLVIRLHPAPLLAYVDPQRMVQVITNLVGNAINYTSEGGQIAVELETEGRRAVLRVRDTGIGIAPEMVEHIFEPFFRAEERVAIGTGLGLTIAREIVVLHGGEISVESEVGQGSTFTVKIDLLAE